MQVETAKNRTHAFAFAMAAAAAAFVCAAFAVPPICAQRSIAPLKLNAAINPNEATLGSLMRLPGVGRSRAQEIIRYRTAFEAENGLRAFECPADLMEVKGIGPKTAEKMAPWLEF
jgi:competence ComEA-like helix-hairpin-helix protein